MTMILDGTLGETFPSWTTAGRPASPAVGQMGYNTTIGQFDVYTSGGWVSMLNTTSTSNKITTSQQPAGSVLQVVNATYSTQVNSTTTTFIDTGLTATITPTSASSKILIFVSQNGCQKPAFDTTINLKLQRNSSDILQFGRFISGNGGASQANLTSASASYLDSPSSTSALTYKTVFNNDTPAGTCNVQFGGAGIYPASTITLMEIAA